MDDNELCDRILARQKQIGFAWWCRDMARQAVALYLKQEKAKSEGARAN